MKRTAHLTDALVLELVTHAELALPTSASAHLASCARCAADVRELRELVAHTRDRDAEPPATVLANVLALMPPAAPKAYKSRAYPLALLVYDSHAAQPDLSLRAVTAVRQLAWRIDGLAIDAEIEFASTGEGGHLVGQVMVDEPTSQSSASHSAHSGDIWLEEPGRDPHWAPLDASGEFSLPAPRGRKWSLWIDWGRWRVRVRGS